MPIGELHNTVDITLRAVPPYDLSLTVHKPAGWSLLTPFEVFEDSTLWTAVRMDSQELFGLKLKSLGTVKNPRVQCTIFSKQKLTPKRTERFSQALAWMLRVDENLGEFYAMAKHDSVVKTIVRDLYGMRRTTRPDIFPSLILAVTLQMAPIKRSRQMWNLLLQNYGAKAKFDAKEILYWPSPERIARTPLSELREKCKLGYRAETIKQLAQTITKRFPTLEQLERMSEKEAKGKLIELKGIGEYSADIISPHPGVALDVWSARIFSTLLTGRTTESPRESILSLKKIAENRWGRWKGYVFVYVLNDLKNLSKQFKLNYTASA
jgi:3-methyladenine DNA glycosylase/8-oxoguanine DNA glycosylase